jgi:hypothetical protein
MRFSVIGHCILLADEVDFVQNLVYYNGLKTRIFMEFGNGETKN